MQWLRDGLRIVENAGETEFLARSLESNDGVYFVPAFTGLGAPHWEPGARGTIVGLTRGSTARAPGARRAGGDGVHHARRGAGDGGGRGRARSRELRVDGGATANNWMMQFQADVLGVPVRRPAMVEMTARGAAGLAGLATGFWASPEEFHAARPDETVFQPAAGDCGRAALLAGWRRALAATRAWATDAG